jgi:hypothetical protein
MGNAISGGSGQHGAFLAAARSGDTDYVLEALRHGPSLKLLFSAQTWTGRTIFHVAAQAGQNELLAAVVEAVAASYPCCRQEKVLTKHGGSPQALVRALANDTDSKGCTPLHVAATHGQEDTIRYLLQLGADPWVKVIAVPAAGRRTAGGAACCCRAPPLPPAHLHPATVQAAPDRNRPPRRTAWAAQPCTTPPALTIRAASGRWPPWCRPARPGTRASGGEGPARAGWPRSPPLSPGSALRPRLPEGQRRPHTWMPAAPCVPPDAAPPRTPAPARSLVDTPNGAGFTPLHYAVWTGSHAALGALLSFDAAQDARSMLANEDWISCSPGSTPLHLAALRGNAEGAKALLLDHVRAGSSRRTACTAARRPACRV